LLDLFDIPPAPKLDVFGNLDPSRATSAELRGEVVFNGKGRCVACHAPPFYTDLTGFSVVTAQQQRRLRDTAFDPGPPMTRL
jgi:cytochrome c peroxidase